MANLESGAHEYHALQAQEARAQYIISRTPLADAKDWNTALTVARKQITAALRASNGLVDIAGALAKSGEHMLAFRHMVAPPISQDQFKLVCPEWRKNTEKISGSRVRREEATAIAAAFEARRARGLTPWIEARRPPMPRELRRLIWSVAPLIASQQIQTLQRTRAALQQEQAIVQLLLAKGWTRRPATLLDKKAALPEKHFMHKTRFATATTAAQEVDIALGLQNTVVLAMECKVSNDETNSVKRINDILKKNAAWKTHWGSFVKTAALLQGVIAPKDVSRLLDDGVEVFWSHNLPSFAEWLESRV
jgi:hypothetical protein